jgi:hypothetical protein
MSKYTSDQIESHHRDVSDFVRREVIYCVSSLIYDLAQQAEHFPEYEEELYSAFQGLPDYQESAEEEGWKQADEDMFFNEQTGKTTTAESWEQLCQAQGIDYERHSTGEDEATDEGWLKLAKGAFYSPDSYCYDDESQDWKALCEEQNIDAQEHAPEVYEHWIVTDWLANKLEERVLRNFFGMTIWGRTCTGQTISLDGVICAIYDDLQAQRKELTQAPGKAPNLTGSPNLNPTTGARTMRNRNQSPYWTTAKFNSQDAHGNPVKKGDRIFYYPSTRTVLTGEAAEQAARDLDAARFDEAQMSGGW